MSDAFRGVTICSSLAVVAALAAACDGQSGRAGEWRGSTRDSAGVSLVDNPAAGSWSAARAWRVAADLSIGTPTGEDAYVFSRIGDVAPGRDGDFVVLEQNPPSVRVFDGSGRFVRRIAAAGRGPGELSAFASDVLLSPEDTIFLPDYAQGRISVYTPDGALVRTIPIPRSPGGRSWELLPGGGFVFRGVAIGRDSLGRFTTWDGLLSLGAEGTALDTVVALDYERTPIGGPGNLRVPLIVNNAFWCGLADGRLAWSALDRDRVFVHRPTGELERVIMHVEWQRRPLTDADRARLEELLRLKLRLLGGDPSAAGGPNVDAPVSLPAITGLRAGPDTTLWVQQMGDLADVHPMAVNAIDRSDWLGGRVWQVFDPRGRFLGAVTLPPRHRVTRITGEFVYGVARDPSDVERVVRLRLVR